MRAVVARSLGPLTLLLATWPARAEVPLSFLDLPRLAREGWRVGSRGPEEPPPPLSALAGGTGLLLPHARHWLELPNRRPQPGPWARAAAGYRLELALSWSGPCAGALLLQPDDGRHQPSIELAPGRLVVAPMLLGTGRPTYRLERALSGAPPRVVTLELRGDTLWVTAGAEPAAELVLPPDAALDVEVDPAMIGRPLPPPLARGAIRLLARDCGVSLQTLLIRTSSRTPGGPAARDLLSAFAGQLPPAWAERFGALGLPDDHARCALEETAYLAARDLVPAMVGRRGAARLAALPAAPPDAARALAAFERPTRWLELEPDAPPPPPSPDERRFPIGSCPDGVDERGRPCCGCGPRPAPPVEVVAPPPRPRCACRTARCEECLRSAGLRCAERPADSEPCAQASFIRGTRRGSYTLSTVVEWPEDPLLRAVFAALVLWREQHSADRHPLQAMESAGQAYARALTVDPRRAPLALERLYRALAALAKRPCRPHS